MSTAVEILERRADRAQAAVAHRDDQPSIRRMPKLGDSVVVHYENLRLNVQCDIEIPITAKTKQARLGNGTGLAMLAYDATITSDWSPAA